MRVVVAAATVRVDLRAGALPLGRRRHRTGRRWPGSRGGSPRGGGGWSSCGGGALNGGGCVVVMSKAFLGCSRLVYGLRLLK